jgi:hypothetical protein
MSQEQHYYWCDISVIATAEPIHSSHTDRQCCCAISLLVASSLNSVKQKKLTQLRLPVQSIVKYNA